ncbi:MAG: hypothetical protein ACYC9X_08290 [Dehalococcoidia bacterium]
MKSWLDQARKDWAAILACCLCYLVVAVYLGPGYYFLLWWTVGSLYILRESLRR